MSKDSMPFDVTLYPAVADDIPLLVQHHRKMFMEIVKVQNTYPKNAEMKEIDMAYQKKLERELDQTCSAWIAVVDNKQVASGAVSLLSMVPVPGDPSCTVAYLHSIYTEIHYRKRGVAAKIAATAMQFCKSQNIHRMMLNASNAGRPIYEKLGFRLSDNHMRLWMP